jgi:hypothetical protein
LPRNGKGRDMKRHCIKPYKEPGLLKNVTYKIEEWADSYLKDQPLFRAERGYINPRWDKNGNILLDMPSANDRWTFEAWKFAMELCRRFKSCYVIHYADNGYILVINVNNEEEK